MNGIAFNIVVALVVVVEYVVVPSLFAWGWVRWLILPKPRTLFSILSFVGFALATASAVLAGSLILYGYSNGAGSVSYQDPWLLPLLRWGFLLSSGAVAFGIAAVWRPSALRWHALACGVATLLFWSLTETTLQSATTR